LVRDGFRGVIYSTAPTKEIAKIMLEDAMGIMSREAEEKGLDPLFEEEDLKKALSMWKVVPYHNTTEFLPGCTFQFRDAGHVLGSAMIEVTHNQKKILFTGDLGNSPNLLLRDIEDVSDIDYVVMESVYGDRLHEHKDDRTKDLERAIEDIAKKGGTLMIPSFSLERTQELLFEINEFIERGRVPKMPIFLDSPLAIKVTHIFRHSMEFFNKHTRALITGGDDVFNFPGLSLTESTDESKAINHTPGPKIVIAGSGMMNGGRILHHALRYLGEKNSILLFVGYQAPGTLGRIIQSGAKNARIYGNDITIKADVRSISGYSGHADRDDLVHLIDTIKNDVQQVFCVMGEPSSAMFLTQRLRDYLGVNATAPAEGDQVMLDFE